MTTIEKTLPLPLALSLPTSEHKELPESSLASAGALRESVMCPVCGTNGMLRETTPSGQPHIHCTNGNCRSNGGKMDMLHHTLDPNAQPFGHFRKIGRYGPWLECRRTDEDAIALFTSPKVQPATAVVERRQVRPGFLASRAGPLLRGLSHYLDMTLAQRQPKEEQLLPMAAYNKRLGPVLCFHFAENQAIPQVKYANPLEPTFDNAYWTHFMRFDMDGVLNAAQAYTGRTCLRQC